MVCFLVSRNTVRVIYSMSAEAGAQLQVLEQKQGNQRGPDLNLQSVGAGADEGLDAKILLQRFENSSICQRWR